ncbi:MULTISPECIES: site-specific integrase [unclassified Frankia]|uniref:site-specific integrase n=1 Tax=unclassified Frankia TaxID=2632575 RepID=UPI001EF3DDBD|nr:MULTISPECIES: site-specific integrase [unclassified Frankia]
MRTPTACARCGRNAVAATTWPDGPICRTCHTRALETFGICAGCARHRMLPGFSTEHKPLCVDCAGIPGNFTCVECGMQGRRWQQRCARCTLTTRLRCLLDDGTGTIRTELIPLFDGLRQMERPASGLNWLGPPYVGQMLRGLATGEIPLTHEGLNTLPHPRAVAYLRDLLMQHHILPPADRQLVFFERWLSHYLTSITNPEHRTTVERFAAWHILRRLRTLAAHGPLGADAQANARAQITQAGAFLAMLDINETTLATCTQYHLDLWHSNTAIARLSSHPFLKWAMSTARMPRLAIQAPTVTDSAPAHQQQRITLITQMLIDENVLLRTRVAALLVLLYAQPVSRIIQLTIDDVTGDTDMFLHLGEHPAPVPEPFAALLRRYIATRTNMKTAANPTTRWLFPGRRPGQPMTTNAIRQLLRHAGVPPQSSRIGAIRQLVLDAPAPVVAAMLGYSHSRTSAHAIHAGAPWSRYATSNHDQ